MNRRVRLTVRLGGRTDWRPLTFAARLSLLGSFSIIRGRFGLAHRCPEDRVHVEGSKLAARRRKNCANINAARAAYQKVSGLKPKTVAMQLCLVVDVK